MAGRNDQLPLVSRSSRLNRLVYESSRPPSASTASSSGGTTVQLHDIPGGPEAFELVARFCCGAVVDLTASNVPAVRCASEYLEMTEDLEEGNLIFKSETFLSYVVLASWRDSVVALRSCQNLSPWAENLRIVRRCCESVAGKACADLSSTVVRRRMTSRRISTSGTGSPKWGNEVIGSPRGSSPGGGPAATPPDWWFEDVALLRIDHFVRVVTAIKVKGMRPDLVGAAVAFYASKWLPGLSPEEELLVGPGGMSGTSGGCRPMQYMVVASGGGTADVTGNLTALSAEAREQRTVLESLISIIPPQLDAVTCEFLLRLLRLAAMLKVAPALVTELEKRVGMQLEQASLQGLLIPSYCRGCDTAYDVDLVLRLIEHFLVFQYNDTDEFPVDVQDGGTGGTGPSSSNSHRAKLAVAATASRVARLVDSYLTEVSRDQNLSLTKFQMLAEALPASARACDDGLYRAVDSYLKAHPTMPEHDRKRLCRVMDCQKLSLDACAHAAQNERLPLRVVVRIVFSEQVKISNAVAGAAIVKNQVTEHLQQQHPLHAYHPVIPSRKQLLEGTPMSFQEGWAAAKKDINTLKFQAGNMKAKYLEMQNDLETLQRQFEIVTSSSSSEPMAAASTPLKPAASGKGGWWGGWKKLVKLTRMSGIAEVEETGTGSGDGGVLPAEWPRKPRPWRNSVS